MQQDDKTQREIRKIAYGLWMQDGQPEGRDREHWEAAKEIWAFRSHNHVLEDDAAEAGKGRRPQAAKSASTTQARGKPQQRPEASPTRKAPPSRSNGQGQR